MEAYSNALFNLIAGIVAATTRDPDGYPVRLLNALKNRFGSILGFFDKLMK